MREPGSKESESDPTDRGGASGATSEGRAGREDGSSADAGDAVTPPPDDASNRLGPEDIERLESAIARILRSL